MTRWVRYVLPAAAIASAASPACAVQYLSIAEAQKQAFPSASQVVEVQAGRGWKAEAGGQGDGLFIFDRVVGNSAIWLWTFVGKAGLSCFKINGDIRNIAGATLSSTHGTEGVKRILATYGNRLR